MKFHQIWKVNSTAKQQQLITRHITGDIEGEDGVETGTILTTRKDGLEGNAIEEAMTDTIEKAMTDIIDIGDITILN